MFVDNLKDELNVSTTENDALGFATTKSNLLDFNFKVASYRSRADKNIIVDFKKAWYENKELALKYLFYARDIREGLGERRLFKVVIKEIANELDDRVLDWIVEYGRYDDLFALIDTKLEKPMLDYIENQLSDDWENMLQGMPISLLAKWMPSINASSKQTKALAKKLIKKFNPEGNCTEKDYRKTLARLRKYLDVTEIKCCTNSWDKIDYTTVPSQANLKYKDAFLRHDSNRRTEYLESLKNGKTTINAGTLFPQDILHKYVCNVYSNQLHDYDAAIEALWKALPNFVNENEQTLVIRDGSGSMCTPLGKTSTTALEVSTALAIYFSEHCSGQFKDTFITFSNAPRLITLTNYGTLRDKVERVFKEDDCSNTDLEATFDLVLNTAINNNLKQKDIPNLLIISDMEFDRAYSSRCSRDKLFETIAKKYHEAGYQLPKLIFWNVDSRTDTIPMTQNKNGVILVSGFSPSICKLILNGETDPYKALLKELTNERYAKITLNK